MAKPFQICAANRTSEKGKSYSNVPVEINGLLWANLEPNMEGQYGYKEETLTLKIKYATGVVDSSGHKWLVGSFDNADQLFDIKVQVANGTKDDGKPKYEASPKEEEVKSKWESDGKLCAILCDSIPQLVYFVEEVAKEKLVFCDEGYEVFIKLNPNKELLKKIDAEIVEQKPDNPSPQRKKNQLHKEFLAENSWYYYAWDDETIVSCLEETGLYSDSLEDLIEGFDLEFDEEGYLSKCVIPWNAPEVKATDKKSWGGGSKGQTEAEILKERKEFILKECGVDSLDKFVLEFGKSLCPIKAELIVAIANGAAWHNRFYSSPVDINQYEMVKSTSNGNGNSNDNSTLHKEEETPEETNGSFNSSRGRKKAKATPTVSSELELEEVEESEQGTEQTNEWIFELESLKEQEPPYLIPKDLSSEKMSELGATWCRLYYTLMTGQLITPKGSLTFKDRASTSFIKSKCGKFPHSMNEEELKNVLKNKALFIPAKDEITAL